MGSWMPANHAYALCFRQEGGVMDSKEERCSLAVLLVKGEPPKGVAWTWHLEVGHVGQGVPTFEAVPGRDCLKGSGKKERWLWR